MASQESEFGGFRPMESNFTPCPNQFFDDVVPNYPACVIAVVAAIIRATLGWKDSVTGEKRAEAEMSIPDIMHRAKLARNTVRSGIRQALDAGLIVETAAAGENTGARYALRWENQELQREAIERSRRSTGDYPEPPRGGGSIIDRGQILTGLESDPHIKKDRSPKKKPLGFSSGKKPLNVGEEPGGEPLAPQHPDSRPEQRSTEENEIYKREVLGPVRDVISLANDAHSWARWVQLREIAVDNNIIPAWEQCILALQQRLTKPGAPALDRPGAWLQSAMVKAFERRGVTVPTGTQEERESVGADIRASLGLGAVEE